MLPDKSLSFYSPTLNVGRPFVISDLNYNDWHGQNSLSNLAGGVSDDITAGGTLSSSIKLSPNSISTENKQSDWIYPEDPASEVYARHVWRSTHMNVPAYQQIFIKLANSAAIQYPTTPH